MEQPFEQDIFNVRPVRTDSLTRHASKHAQGVTMLALLARQALGLARYCEVLAISLSMNE